MYLTKEKGIWTACNDMWCISSYSLDIVIDILISYKHNKGLSVL